MADIHAMAKRLNLAADRIAERAPEDNATLLRAAADCINTLYTIKEALQAHVEFLKAPNPQPVTSAGGEIEPTFWMAPMLATMCHSLGDAAIVHNVHLATKPHAGFTTPLYATHPPVASPPWKDGCPFAVTKGGQTICQPPKRLQKPPVADAALDDARFEWLGQQMRTSTAYMDGRFSFDAASFAMRKHNLRGRDIREAIDYAMRSEDAALNQRGGA